EAGPTPREGPPPVTPRRVSPGAGTLWPRTGRPLCASLGRGPSGRRDNPGPAHVLGHVAQIPHETELRQAAQHPVEAVDLAREEAGSRRAGIVVVVIVPTLAEKDNPEHPMIGRAIAGGVAALAARVTDVVDGGCAVDGEQAPGQAVGGCEHREASAQPDE